MAFNVHSWSTVSSSGNLDVQALQDGSYVGTPSNHTYIHAVDTVATISGANYFNEVAAELHIYDRIYAIGSDGIVDLRVTAVTFNPTVVTTTTTLGLGDVNGPAFATDNAISRYNGITGKIIQNSGVIVSDVDAITGVTSLTVDNLNLNGNSIISTDANGNITIEPNGVGEVQLNSASVTVEQDIIHSGDANNKIVFGADTQSLETGGASRLDASDAGVRFGAANARITTTLDEDNMASDSATSLATQQSIKAYADAIIAAAYSRAVNQVAHGFTGGELVYLNAGAYTAARANAVGTSDVIGIVTAVAGVDDFTLQFSGYVNSGVTGLTANAVTFLSSTVAGAHQNAAPTGVGEVIKPVLIADGTTSGVWVNQLGVLI